MINFERLCEELRRLDSTKIVTEEIHEYGGSHYDEIIRTRIVSKTTRPRIEYLKESFQINFSEIDLDQFKMLLELFDDRDKHDVCDICSESIKQWIDNPENRIDLYQVREVLKLINDSGKAKEILSIWLKGDNADEIGSKSFEEFFGDLIKYSDLTPESRLVLYVRDHAELNQKYVARARGKINELYEIISVSLGEDEIADFSKIIHPQDDEKRKTLFLRMFEKKITRGETENIPKDQILKLLSFTDDYAKLEVLLKSFELNEEELLRVQDRITHTRYFPLKDMLKQAKLCDVLQENVSDPLLANLSPEMRQELSALCIFNRSFSRGFPDFYKMSRLFKPEFFQQVRSVYVENSVNYGKSEEGNLQHLATLYQVRQITDCLKKAVQKIGSPPKHYRFGNSLLLQNFYGSEEEISSISNDFIRLTKSLASANQVVDIFSRILCLDEEGKRLLGKESSKLQDFFEGNTREIVYFFAQDQAIDNFSKAILGIGDGCVSNIATQFRMCLYEKLIENPVDRALYVFFREKIVPNAVNDPKRGNDNLNGDPRGIDAFESSVINRKLFAAKALFHGLRNQMDGENKVSDPWRIIQSELGEEVFEELMEVVQKNPNLANAKAINSASATIGAYVVILNRFPEIAQDKDLDQVRDEVLDIIGAEAESLLEAPRKIMPTPSRVEKVVAENITSQDALNLENSPESNIVIRESRSLISRIYNSVTATLRSSSNPNNRR